MSTVWECPNPSIYLSFQSIIVSVYELLFVFFTVHCFIVAELKKPVTLPVLVMTCNRPDNLERTLSQVIKWVVFLSSVIYIFVSYLFSLIYLLLDCLSANLQMLHHFWYLTYPSFLTCTWNPAKGLICCLMSDWSFLTCCSAHLQQHLVQHLSCEIFIT